MNKNNLKKYLIKKRESLSSNVMRIILEPENKKNTIKYRAGQYALIKQTENRFAPYSIANAPQENSNIELHIRIRKEDDLLMKMVEKIYKNEAIEISSAAGRCCLPKDKLPLLCLAGGTGFAPIKAIIEQAIKNNDSREIILYWSVKNKKGIYLPQTINSFNEKIKNFSVLIISNEDIDHTTLPHKTCNIENALSEISGKITNYNIIAAGPFPMVENCWQQAKSLGVSPQQFYTDMLDPK